MITKKLIIIFLLIIALIIILIKKHKNKKVEIEHFILNLDIQEENDYDNIVSTYYNNNNIHVPIINSFGIVETNNIDIQKDINSSNITFNNLNSKELNTNIFNTKDSTIKNINSSDNIENTTDNYNKFTKLNTENINTNTITNSNNTTFKNMTILDNLNIENNNFSNSIMYVDSLCFENNKCFNKSIFDDIRKIDLIKEQYSSPLYQYMYLPNSRNTNGNIIYDKNLIWNNIRNEISPDNNAEGKLKSINQNWVLSYNTTQWYGKNIYKISYPVIGTIVYYYQNDGTGIEIRVPEHPNKNKGEDYTVLWVQTISDRWTCFRVYEYDINNKVVVKYFHKHITGFNNLNKICPDGTTQNDVWNAFEWTPIPIDLTGNTNRKLMISIFYENTPLGDQSWFSGFAFSTNPWNHYKCHALEIHWQIHLLENNILIDKINNQNPYIGWAYENNQPLGVFVTGASAIFRIPIVNNNKDKIFYFVEANQTHVTSIPNIAIYNNDGNEINLGNMYTTFDNPFSRHFNSKVNQRYFGVKIPKEYLPVNTQTYTKNSNFIKLRIYTNIGGKDIKFTEVGTHDFSPI